MTDRRPSRRHILTGALKWAGILGGLAALRVPTPALARQKERLVDGIVGSWIVSIAYAPGGDRTRGLATFTSDGAFVGSVSAFEEAPANPTPSRGTTLHGSWLSLGGPDYAVTAIRLHLDQQGLLLGTMTTQISLTLDETSDIWGGTFSFDAADPVGTVFRSDTGTVHGMRIKVEP
jgi:hypothetical protein